MVDEAGAEALADWDGEARQLAWTRPWRALYEADDSSVRWFVDGELDVAANCLDRHVDTEGEKIAVLWEGEPGDRVAINYRQLAADVDALACGLYELGVRGGDKVVLHLGLLPETVTAMLACARIGAVHCILSTTLPADALADRIYELAPKVLFTQGGAWRHGTIIPTKSRADEVVAAAGTAVEWTVVVRRTGVDIEYFEGDICYEDVPQAAKLMSASLPADSPLLAFQHAIQRHGLISIEHPRAAFLVYANAMHRRGLSPETENERNVFWYAADLAWAGMQTHGIYGPLVAGGTTVLFEGTLDVPTRERAWQILDRYSITSLATTPSVARSLRTWATTDRIRRAATQLNRVITFGEAIDPETTRWLEDELGAGHATVLDGWGQTELGGIVHLDPRPKDGPPDPGLAVINEQNETLSANEPGHLVLTHPWPVMHLRAAEGSRAKSGNYRDSSGRYFTRDIAVLDDNDSLTIVGRIDPVIKVSGQLVATGEVANVLIEHPAVLDAEVVPRPHSRTGQAVAACVVLAPTSRHSDPVRLAHELRLHVHDVLGGLAQPSIVAFCERIPRDEPSALLRDALSLLCAATTDEWCFLNSQQIKSATTAVLSPRSGQVRR